ncbi:MAG: TonB-dependent receptor plug domain-containing protein, partial [Desulfatiglandales bacterium]
MKKLITLALFLCLFWPFGMAGAEERIKKTLPEVVVTESRIEETRKEVTTNVVIIPEEEIQRSPAKDLGDLLAEKGLPIIKYPGTLASTQIRGFRTEVTGNDLLSRVLVLIDGRRASTGNLAKILTKNVERIEIITGPASVQYGSAAMGGVINVITKQGRDKPSTFLEGKMGSWGYEEGTVGFDGKYDRFDFSASFTRDTMDDYDTGGGKKYYNTGYKSRESASINLGYEFISGNRLGILYHYFDGKHIGTPDYITANDMDDYAEKKLYSWDLVYSGKTRDNKILWTGRYFEGKDKNAWVDPVDSNPDGWDDGIPTESQIKQKGGQAQISSDLDVILASLGFDWVKYDVTNSWDPKESTYDNPAYYLLIKSKFFDKRLIASGGIRYDKYEVEVKGGQGGAQSSDKFSPRFGLAYLITNNLKIRTNYG